MQARDIMTTNVVSISPVVSVRHAVATMLQNHVSGLPVVDDLGRVCGMITEGDLLLRREVRFSPRPARAPELISEIDLERYIGSNGWCVADIMSQYNAVDIDERASQWKTQGWSGYDESAPRYSRTEEHNQRARPLMSARLELTLNVIFVQRELTLTTLSGLSQSKVKFLSRAQSCRET